MRGRIMGVANVMGEVNLKLIIKLHKNLFGKPRLIVGFMKEE
jgi:hypothetical protein